MLSLSRVGALASSTLAKNKCRVKTCAETGTPPGRGCQTPGMPHLVRIHGRDVAVEGSSGKRVRLLVNGSELPRDRFGRYELTDDAGTVRVVETSFDVRNFAYVLQVGDERVPAAPPLARGSWLLLGPVLVLSLFGGALGVGIGLTAVWQASRQLRRGARGWPAAAAVVLLAVLAYVGSVVLLSAIF